MLHAVFCVAEADKRTISQRSQKTGLLFLRENKVEKIHWSRNGNRHPSENCADCELLPMENSHAVSAETPNRALIALLAFAAGVTVANLYYCQPVLGAMAQTFHVAQSAVSMVATATQLGYATGLLLVVPLGDSFERRRLIVMTAAGSALTLLLVAFSLRFSFLLASSFLVGAVSITPQLVVPYAAGLVASGNRGRVVGTVMSGLLVGILLSRTLSGFVSAAFGWRSVYVISAAMVLGLTLLLAFTLPAQAPEQQHHRFHYGHLLGSLFVLLKNEPILRRHSIIGACGFAAFSAFWTTLAFHLQSLPGHYGSAAVGLFGLFGAAGALVAPVSGRLADRYEARHVNGAALALIVVSFLLMAVGEKSLLALAAGVVLMDAGVQGSHISNQTRIYALHPALRNRLNSVYMVSYFLGGTLGSALGAWAWTRAGWLGVCLCAAVLAGLGLITLFAKAIPLTHPHDQHAPH